MESKTVSVSRTVMTEMVMPNDTNALNNLMGGNLLKWMDVAGAICARRHANRVCVTASVDMVSFEQPIHLGEIVCVVAKATRVFNTSMEVHIVVYAEGLRADNRRKCNEAYFTFVGIDENGYKVKLPKLIPETEEEQLAHASALRRREMRLILAGKMKPSQSEELRAIFLKS